MVDFSGDAVQRARARRDKMDTFEGETRAGYGRLWWMTWTLTNTPNKESVWARERERESVCVCVCVHKLWTAPVKRGHFIYLWLLCLRDGQGQAMCLLSCFCFVSWINLRNMSVNNSTDTHLSIPAVFHHGNPSPTAASLTLDREVFSTSSDIYTSVKKPLFICCTERFLQHVSLYGSWWSMSFPHVDCRCNPMEDWTPSIWIEQAGEVVIWLWDTHCKHHVKNVPWTATSRFSKSSPLWTSQHSVSRVFIAICA